MKETTLHLIKPINHQQTTPAGFVKMCNKKQVQYRVKSIDDDIVGDVFYCQEFIHYLINHFGKLTTRRGTLCYFSLRTHLQFINQSQASKIIRKNVIGAFENAEGA